MLEAKQSMEILLTNDDGILATGILSLKRELSKIGKVYVVAPDGERSSISHAITLNHPLRINEVFFGDEFLGYSTTGTPVDCVILALKGLLKEKRIDYIVSGINHGANLGEDVIYSGTVSAAFEGCLFGIPAYAFSKQILHNELPFEDAAYLAKGVIVFFSRILKKSKYILNINFPDIPLNKIKGIQITRLGKRIYNDRLEERKDPRGRSYYWIGGESPSGKLEEGTDIFAISEGFVSVTPLSLDVVNYDLLSSLKTEVGETISIGGMLNDFKEI